MLLLLALEVFDTLEALLTFEVFEVFDILDSFDPRLCASNDLPLLRLFASEVSLLYLLGSTLLFSFLRDVWISRSFFELRYFSRSRRDLSFIAEVWRWSEDDPAYVLYFLSPEEFIAGDGWRTNAFRVLEVLHGVFLPLLMAVLDLLRVRFRGGDSPLPENGAIVCILVEHSAPGLNGSDDCSCIG